MPQRFGLYEDLTVAGKSRPVRRPARRDRRRSPPGFERLLAFTALGPFTGRLAGKLSGGMKQKLGLACCLIHAPRVAVARRAQRRRRSDLAPRAVADGLRAGRSRASASCGARPIWTRPSAAPRSLLLNEGKSPLSGPPKELTASVAGRTFLVAESGRPTPQVLAHGAQTARSGRRRDPRQQRAPGDGREGESPDVDGAGRRDGARSSPRRRASKTPSSICWAAGRRASSPLVVAAGDRRDVATEIVVEAQRPDQAIRRLHRRRQYLVSHQPRRDLRPARSQRGRQVDHVQDDVRLAAADRRHGARGRLRPVSGRRAARDGGWATWRRSSRSTAT